MSTNVHTTLQVLCEDTHAALHIGLATARVAGLVERRSGPESVLRISQIERQLHLPASTRAHDAALVVQLRRLQRVPRRVAW